MSSGGRPFLLTSWQPHVLQFLKRIYRSIGHSPGVAIILSALKYLRHHLVASCHYVLMVLGAISHLRADSTPMEYNGLACYNC